MTKQVIQVIMKHWKKLVEDKQNGKGQEQEEANMAEFDELIVIFYCSHEYYGVDYSSSWMAILEHHFMLYLI